jgi:hypothetical protein
VAGDLERDQLAVVREAQQRHDRLLDDAAVAGQDHRLARVALGEVAPRRANAQ